jgi:hypothetical protein
MAIAELIELVSTFKRVELGAREEQILACAADGLNTAYRIHSHIRKKEPTFDYKNVTKRVRRLHELKLLREMKGPRYESAHRAKFYRLSSEGLFYLLTRCPIERGWLFEYKDDTILKELLYPYFTPHIAGNISTNDIPNYLRACCHLLLDYLRTIKTPSNYPSTKTEGRRILRQLETDLEWEAKILAFKLLIKKSAPESGNNVEFLEADTRFMAFSKGVEKEFGRIFTRLVE